MKRVVATLLCLALVFTLPAISFAEDADEDAPLTALENSVCTAYDPELLRTEELLTELPDWLSALIFAEDDASHAISLRPATPSSLGGTSGSTTTWEPVPGASEETPGGTIIAPAPVPAFAPSLYEPYTVTKTKTYYDKNGAAAYVLMLSAVFVDTNAGTTCLKTNADYHIYSGSWRITPGEPTVSGRMVTAAFTVEQLFTGVPVKSETVAVTLFSYERTGKGYLRGDLNGDGTVTTADARTALRIAIGLEPQTDYTLRLADLNGDGFVTTADARGILRMAVGL